MKHIVRDIASNINRVLTPNAGGEVVIDARQAQMMAAALNVLATIVVCTFNEHRRTLMALFHLSAA